MNTGQFVMLPFPNSEQDAHENVLAVERMLEQDEIAEAVSKRSWDALSPDEKREALEKPELELGIRKCPNCGMIPRCHRSLAEGFSFNPVIYCFSEEARKRAMKAYCMSRCSNHNTEAARLEMMDMRFNTFDELKDYWNGLLNKP